MSQLNELVNSSNEARVIFQAFSKRIRVHRRVGVRSLFYNLSKVSPTKLDRISFNLVFLNLEELGEGKCVFSKFNTLVEFIPKRSIVELGKDAVKVIGLPPKRLNSKVIRVIVEFDINGHKGKAELPTEALTAFEDMLRSG